MSPALRMTLEDAPGGLHCDIPVIDGISAGISLAAAGDMALSRDATSPWRSRLLAQRDIRRDRLYGLRQVHSRRCQLIDEQQAEEAAAIEADGLFTMKSDAVLSVTVADCLPVFLADRRTGAFGIVHSGWRGTGIVREALALMTTWFGSQPAEVAAVIGPGIGACCYTVPEERAVRFAAEYGSDTIQRGEDGTLRLDLRAANIHLLEGAGVQEIGVVTDCTSCSKKLGSFRRQGPAEYTLMLAWIGGRA
ncbi:MAG: polyphenol oxidase family protein [Spirochaetia bacterium]|jgi:YfiH family protein